MKTSRYFANLTSSYRAELDDLRTDSEGKDILRQRLATKRKQMQQLLPMMQFAPEMVAAAFHGGFTFKQKKTLEALVAKETGSLPGWATLSQALTIEPWAEPLIAIVLTDAHGEHFLATTVGLEYLHRHGHENAAAPSGDELDQDEEELEHDQELQDHDHNEDYLSSDDVISNEGESNEFDLDKAGAEFLAGQGFDRKE